MQAEVKELDNQIIQNKEVLTSLEEDLEKLKKEYADAITSSYKSQRLKDKVSMIFSAKNINEALRRMNYLRKYTSYRQKQAFYIKETQASIQAKIEEIEQHKKEKSLLLKDEIGQKENLSKEKKEKDQLVADLKSKEKSLASEIKNKQRQARKLNKQIEEIIRKEIEAARKKREGNTISTTAYKDTPEYKNLSSSFVTNKGKLPWPVEKGFISRHFGEYNHPDLKNVKFENNGIDIKTEKNASVRAIFKGKVISVINNPLYKNAVIINHGAYFSVYSKLKTVNVRINDEVDTKEIIGVAYTDGETNNTEVHLEIWKGTVKSNPINWIFRK